MQTAEAELITLPSTIRDRAAIDHQSNVVYVDRRCSGDPLLLTWQHKNSVIGHKMTIKPVEIDELAKLRISLFVSEEDEDQKNRAEAIELIKKAAEYKASDIHFMMRGTYTEIQVVLNGGLRVLRRTTQKDGEAITRAAYQGLAKTRTSSFNPLDYQDAQIPGSELPPETGLTSIRIIRGPSYPVAQDGLFMTLRLQYGSVQTDHKSKDLPQLELPRRPEGELLLGQMGYEEPQIDKLRMLMDAPNGIVIVTGPTGSGKTTTIYELLMEQARSKPHWRQVTVEDPVEYPMEWAVQMPVTGAKDDAETGIAFGNCLRVSLRMAPKIILVGEMRGPEVAAHALEASVTGHQLWTTMHVTDPFLFVERLELMDQKMLHRRVFCDHKIVRGVVATALLTKLCRHCSVPATDKPEALSKHIIAALETWGKLSDVRLHGPGCEHCGNTGARGRFAIAEVVVLDAAVMNDFIERGSEVARNNYRERPNADRSILESAIAHIFEGNVDPRDVQDSVDLIEPRDRRRGKHAQ